MSALTPKGLRIKIGGLKRRIFWANKRIDKQKIVIEESHQQIDALSKELPVETPQ